MYWVVKNLTLERTYQRRRLDRLFCDSCTYLRVSLKVIVEYVHTDGQVTSVEGIRPVPALRTKLSPLGHTRVEIAQRKQNTLEFILSGAHLKCVLARRRKKCRKKITL